MGGEPCEGRDGSAWKAYAYDARGNVSDGDRLTFTYDAAEQPTSMSGAASGSFTYDGNLKRVKQVIDGETIYSVYSLPGALLYRDNVTTGEATDYVRVAGHMVARIRNCVTSYLHQDHLGKCLRITSRQAA